MRKIQILIIFTIIIILQTTLIKVPIHAANSLISLPIENTTRFYLTSTPGTHYPSNTRAAIDLQIIDKLGFIDKGAPLYAPFDGIAEITESPNGSLTLGITKSDNEWKVNISHIANDTQKARELIESYPKRVITGELVAFQGDSGYVNNGNFPVHVHYELFIQKDGEYINNNEIIDICSRLKLSHYCKWVDKHSRVILIEDH